MNYTFIKLLGLFFLASLCAFTQIRNNDYIKGYLQEGNDNLIKDYTKNYLNSIKVNPDDVRGFINRGYKKIENSLLYDAISDFNQALSIDSNNAMAYCLKGVAYGQLNLNDSAYCYLNKAIKRSPAYEWAYLERGNFYLKQMNYKMAEADYLTAIKYNKGLLPAYLNMGYVGTLKNDLNQSINYYSKAIKVKPWIAEGHSRLAEILFLQKKYKNAIKNINLALQIENQNINFLLQKTKYLFKNQQYSEALHELNTIVKKDSTLFEPIYQSAFIKFEMGICDEAVEDLIKGVKKKYRFARQKEPMTFVEKTILELGTVQKREKLYTTFCLLTQKKNKEALLEAKKVIKNDTTQSILYKLLGFLYQEYGFLDSSLSMYNHYSKLEPKDHGVFDLLGDVYRLTEGYGMAEESYQRAIDLGMKDIRILYKLAFVQSFLKKNEEAIINFTKAIKLDSSVAVFYSDRGYLYSVTNQTDKAIKDFRKAIQLDPILALPYNNLGNELLSQGDTLSAIDYFYNAIAIDSTLKFPYYNLSLIYSSRQDYEKSNRFRAKFVKYETLEKNNIPKSTVKDVLENIKNFKSLNDAGPARIKTNTDQNSDLSNYYSQRSIELMKTDSLQSSMEYINKSINKRPYKQEYWTIKYTIYAKQKNYFKALRFLDSLAERFPTYNVYSKKADCYDKLGNDKLAILNYNKSLEQFPKDFKVSADFSKFYSNRRDTTSALKTINKLYVTDSLNIEILVQRGYILITLKKYEIAIRNYEKLIKIDSTQSLAFGNIGWAKFSQNKFEECITFSNKAIELNKGAYYAKYNIALSLLCLNKFEQANKYYQEIYDWQRTYFKNVRIDGAVNDLINLIKEKKHVKHSSQILTNVFGLSEQKIDELAKE